MIPDLRRGDGRAGATDKRDQRKGQGVLRLRDLDGARHDDDMGRWPARRQDASPGRWRRRTRPATDAWHRGGPPGGDGEPRDSPIIGAGTRAAQRRLWAARERSGRGGLPSALAGPGTVTGSFAEKAARGEAIASGDVVGRQAVEAEPNELRGHGAAGRPGPLRATRRRR